jgi:hypothetical protein
MAFINGFETPTTAAFSMHRSSASTLQSSERKDLPLVAVIGAMLSDPLRAVQSLLEHLSRGGIATPAHIRHVHGALALIRSVSMQSQQIARLGGGRLRQSHEKLKLDDLLRETLLERRALFRQHGVELHHNLKAVEVIVDAGLLVCLIDAAFEWALGRGRKLVITLEMKNWPEHGILTIRADGGFALAEKNTLHTDDEGNTLAWYLLAETASVMGVSVNRMTSDRESTLIIEFPRTVKRLAGLTAVEVDTGQGNFGGDSKPMAGHRVLIITNDNLLRIEMQNTARSLGLVLDFVLDSRQGVRFCELDLPHMIIIDERVRDAVFNELKADLCKTDPHYPFIEIANKSNILEMAGWMSDSMTRISRDGLRTQLIPILAMELAKVS